jgi:alpha-D-ribose 1-methylphosphonate 5-triphosphate synthase subunit PhnH
MSLDRPGFADPVLDAQRCFRQVLDAMSRPGRIASVGEALSPPPPLAPATAAFLLTLVDPETPLWLDPAAEAARDWLAFHCGAPIVAAPGQAAFAVVAGDPIRLDSLNPGTHEEPEASATLILQLSALGEGTALTLAGAGIRERTTLQAAGLPDGFAAEWAANHGRFPCGVDVVLCAGTRLAALPRSVRIEGVD